MVDQYPADIRGWIVAMGGVEQMPVAELLGAAGADTVEAGLPQMCQLIDPEARSMACPGGRGGDASREIAGLAPRLASATPLSTHGRSFGGI